MNPESLLEVAGMIIVAVISGDSIVKFAFEKFSKRNKMLKNIEQKLDEHDERFDQLDQSIGKVQQTADVLCDSDKEQNSMILRDLYLKYQARGWWTPAEKARWKKLFQVYTSLGGNGTIAEYNNEISRLPVREPEEGR